MTGVQTCALPILLEQVSEALRYKHYSLKTEQAYVYWVRFFVRWCGRGGLMKHPRRIWLESDPDCSARRAAGHDIFKR